MQPFKKTSLLIEDGSIFDLAASIFIAVDRQKPTAQRQHEVLNTLATILNNGYTYDAINAEIKAACVENRPVDFGKFNGVIKDGNLLKHGTRYYHQQLNRVNEDLYTPREVYDPKTGTMVSSGIDYEDFWIEPRASYTIEDLLKYFYSKHMCNQKVYHPNRMRALFSKLIEQNGIDIVLLSVERAFRDFHRNGSLFDIKKLDEYVGYGFQYMQDCKYHTADVEGGKYVCRKRKLFD